MKKLRKRAYARQFGFKYRRGKGDTFFCRNKSKGFGFAGMSPYTDEEFIYFFNKCLGLMEGLEDETD